MRHGWEQNPTQLIVIYVFEGRLQTKNFESEDDLTTWLNVEYENEQNLDGLFKDAQITIIQGWHRNIGNQFGTKRKYHLLP